MPSAPPSSTKSTKRVPGRWSELTVTGDELSPEASVTIPWLSAENFERVVHSATEGEGFSFEHGLERRPDVVLGERDIVLDRAETRRRLLLGVGVGVLGLFFTILGVTVFLPSAALFGLTFPALVAGALAMATGLTVGTQSRWESELLRVRLDPLTTRAKGPHLTISGKNRPLSVKVFAGRVASSSTSSKAGTFRSFQEAIPSSFLSGVASHVASRISELAQSVRPNLLPGSALPASAVAPVSEGRRSANFLPLVSKFGRPEWYAYPRWFAWFRVAAMMGPMVFLIFGPLLMALPWNYQTVNFTSASPSSQSLPGEAWSPTGATDGQIWWNTVNRVTGGEVDNVPVTVALCPIGTAAIDPSSCRPALGSSLTAATSGSGAVSIPGGWRVVAMANVSDICSDCRTTVQFSSPELALGLGLTLVGVGVLVLCAVVWVRTRRRVRSVWPE